MALEPKVEDKKKSSLDPPTEFLSEASLIHRQVEDVMFITMSESLVKNGYPPPLVIGGEVNRSFENQLTHLSVNSDVLYTKLLEDDMKGMRKGSVRRL